MTDNGTVTIPVQRYDELLHHEVALFNLEERISDEAWYERERAAFIAWWESEGEKKFGATPTMAAGAGWFAKAEAIRSASMNKESK